MQGPTVLSRNTSKKIQQENCYVWLQQCPRGAWRVCPDIRTTHGTSFVPQLRSVFPTVFKSAFTDAFRSVFGSTANRATAGACRVKDGYKRISCLAVGPSGKASRHLRGYDAASSRSVLHHALRAWYYWHEFSSSKSHRQFCASASALARRALRGWRRWTIRTRRRSSASTLVPCPS